MPRSLPCSILRFVITCGCWLATASPLLAAKEIRAKPPLNIVLVICDQEQDRLLSAPGYHLPAREELARRGITFTNHYIASAMCSPSRAAMLTGLPPQRNGVFDQMEYPYQQSLMPSVPNMGSVFKQMGYATAYFGKFEMDKSLLEYRDSVNYSTALRSYGFDKLGVGGDVSSKPDSGYEHDANTAGNCVQWLRSRQVDPARRDQPFFLAASFLNPHDIMYADANQQGERVQQGIAHHELTKPPAKHALPEGLAVPAAAEPRRIVERSRHAAALAIYNAGWSGALGYIPTSRKDMWHTYYNDYLNMIRDNDRSLQQIVDVLSEQGLWENTVVIFTADHGEMGGSHGGLRGKGPFAYRENSKVPFIVVHPDYRSGRSNVLTSHLDLLPTFVGLTGLSEAERPENVRHLPGHDFSRTLAESERTKVHAIRAGVLFNYVAPQTVERGFLHAAAHQRQRRCQQPAIVAGRDQIGFGYAGLPGFHLRRPLQVRPLLRSESLQHARDPRRAVRSQ